MTNRWLCFYFALFLILPNFIVPNASLVRSSMAQEAAITPPPFQPLAKQAILIDLLSGASLFEHHADQRVAPASMTKMMTAYLVFERLERGILSLDDQFLVSEKAWRKGGSKMFVEVGKQVSLDALLKGIIIQSGNDATIVVAEALAGSELAFAELMTAKARELGMNNTQFKNASGWPEEGHYSTVRDLATLGVAIVTNFPDYYKLYQEREYTYNGIRQFNRNPILGKINGVDGIKTGHVEAAGYGLTASADRNGRRLVMVVHGLNSVQEREQEASRLMEWGYERWGYYKFFSKGVRLTEIPVWLGDEPYAQAVLNSQVALNLPRTQIDQISFHVKGEAPVKAPVNRGDVLGRLELRIGDKIIQTHQLVAADPVAALSGFSRIMTAGRHLLFGE